MGNKEQIYGRNDMVLLDKHNKIYGSLGIVEPYVFDTKTGETIVMENPKKGKFEDAVTEFNVYGKSTQVTTTGAQLLNPKSFGADINVEGCTIRSNGDGSIFISKAKTASSVTYELGDMTDKLVNKKAYTAGNSNINGKNVIIQFVIRRDTETLYASTFTYSDSLDKSVFVRIVLTANDVCEGTISPMVNEGASAKPYQPYTGGKPSPSIEYPQEIVSMGDKGEIGVSVYGGNLIPETQIVDVNFNKKDNGTHYGYSEWINVVPDNTYIFNENMIVKIVDTLGNTLFSGQTSSKKVIIPHDGVRLKCRTVVGIDILGSDFKLMMNIGDKIFQFEPYKEPQTLTLSTPNGLPGIPVSTGGNYTDSKGQQWVCDEKDHARGKYVQRIYNMKIDENVIESITLNWEKEDKISYRFRIRVSAKINEKCLSNRFVYATYPFAIVVSNQSVYLEFGDKTVMPTIELLKQFLTENITTIAYQLATPIETDLTPEEIAAYKALHTNYPTTVIMNDENAGMKVTYKQLESKTKAVN